MKAENNSSEDEAGFIALLEQKSRDQRRLAETEIIPGWAKGVGDWLVVHPWRVLVPMAGIGYLAMRVIWGIEFRELILGLFGGFAR